MPGTHVVEKENRSRKLASVYNISKSINVIKINKTSVLWTKVGMWIVFVNLTQRPVT